MRFSLISFLLPILFLLMSLSSTAQSPKAKDVAAVKTLLNTQQRSWNEGDLVAFMNGYWESDSLKFIGSKGLTYGWENTLENYKTSYSDKAKMGKLSFDLLHFVKLGRKNMLLVGKWHLARQMGDLEGHFTLTLEKMKGKWVIIADHSS